MRKTIFASILFIALLAPNIAAAATPVVRWELLSIGICGRTATAGLRLTLTDETQRLGVLTKNGKVHEVDGNVVGKRDYYKTVRSVPSGTRFDYYLVDPVHPAYSHPPALAQAYTVAGAGVQHRYVRNASSLTRCAPVVLTG